jgi:hypothetical protein
VWKTTPETCGKQVENFCYMALWGVTRIHRCFQNTPAPWLLRHAPSIDYRKPTCKCPISRAVSMDRRNTSLKSICEGPTAKSRSRADSNGTPPWLGLIEYSRTGRFSWGKYCRIFRLEVLHRPVELAALIRTYALQDRIPWSFSLVSGRSLATNTRYAPLVRRSFHCGAIHS